VCYTRSLVRPPAAGFDYNFNALKQDHDELSDSFQQMFAYGSDINMLLILQSYIPFFKIIVRAGCAGTRQWIGADPSGPPAPARSPPGSRVRPPRRSSRWRPSARYAWEPSSSEGWSTVADSLTHLTLIAPQKLVEAKKQAVIDSVKDSAGVVDGDVAVGKKDLVGKDVLSSLSGSCPFTLRATVGSSS
jgi:hypothetical protein